MLLRKICIIILFSIVTFPVQARSVHYRPHRRKPSFYQRIRHPFWHPVFPPTHESQLRQNAEIDRLGLPRIKNQEQVESLVMRKELVPLPLGPHLTANPLLDQDRRYCRPLAAQFLTDLSDAFYARFHVPLQVNSAVRTVEYQHRLRRWNANAAPENGDVASSHLAGLTVDLERKRLTAEQIHFIEMRLLLLNMQGKVEVEEEHYQLCFHIMVMGNYAAGTQYELEPLPIISQLDVE
jgi:hypothetical protein